MEQGTATFQRQHSLADDIDWLLNGTSMNRAGLTNVSSSVTIQRQCQQPCIIGIVCAGEVT